MASASGSALRTRTPGPGRSTLPTGAKHPAAARISPALRRPALLLLLLLLLLLPPPPLPAGPPPPLLRVEVLPLLMPPLQLLLPHTSLLLPGSVLICLPQKSHCAMGGGLGVPPLQLEINPRPPDRLLQGRITLACLMSSRRRKRTSSRSRSTLWRGRRLRRSTRIAAARLCAQGH